VPARKPENRARLALARLLLWRTDMATPDSPKPKFEAWTIPFHVIMWTTLLVGLIMVMAVILMH
jgi:hypothetical protein